MHFAKRLQVREEQECDADVHREPKGHDDDELRSFRPTQLKKLQELHVQLDNKFNEIVELLARELNHAKNDPRVHDEAESAIQRWAEDAQMAENPIESKGELQRLLKEHHQIAEEIMDVRDWAMEN